ncbi:glycine--tRNA ligase subunit beta [Commensalibacter papalotli (ex Botero et al. 2024)]|uniref:Glycine--tRNA ligase beta subunit n=1 Tax=Commensalibacter papalotli (ex Botero et al. 2024) TaxID=2972766 RepID=A0ABM9HN71_9PROT|nr:glycine--tRNA ligase subunit beta [Commensalibacter papalotli (ex Botero et al. 2024)]CAI3936427.1 Glycyl-tRNA synthetase [Commensalibacter papalotli (ex Botero et al. 2024)]CAI3939243.1 Glycyl-tRNA synthetase [Commensalibacter papalotli (ex Botero et al. 2024)]
MSELFIELFSEEIPARMQRQATENLQRLLCDALGNLSPQQIKTFSTPRRIAIQLAIKNSIPAQEVQERGPRTTAPEKALEGFLRKHQAQKSDLIEENGFWVLQKKVAAVSATDFIAQALPQIFWKFPWPKSQRWGNGSQFTWVRPLHYITCLLDGLIIPLNLATSEDDAHGLVCSNKTKGHRYLAPEIFEIQNAQQWEDTLEFRFVIADPDKRREKILNDITALTQKANLELVPDEGLLNEVTGLVEWPVPLLGKIDEIFMDLPPEVMQVSMRVNQRYFALKNKDGSPASAFAFVANIIPDDEGKLIIAGNERVLRARFADARYFWDQDRKTSLERRNKQLQNVIFHAKLGSQYERIQRLERLAGYLAKQLKADEKIAKRAALLCKADLTTGMVGEFPEVQGIMGGYYAKHDQESPEVALAISEHYKPVGPSDSVPTQIVSIITALADKIDLLTTFFAIGEKPSGSGDPYALRRAALGVIRIIRENQLRLDIKALFDFAVLGLPQALQSSGDLGLLSEFIYERLYVQLRSEGSRYDILSAVAPTKQFTDLVELLKKVEAITTFVATNDGKDLLAAVKRASNILRIENKKDGPHQGETDIALFTQDEEKNLSSALNKAMEQISASVKQEQFDKAMNSITTLKGPLDLFFEKVTINDENSAIRSNRLKLLSQIDQTACLIADFNQIEK